MKNMITEVQSETELLELLIDQKSLIVYNDDFNTFDHVINSLIQVCQHNPIQAEQCTWIIHNNGKCQVKKGIEDELLSMCTALLDRGLSAEVE